MSGERLNGTEEALLLAIQQRLRDKVAGFNESNCFVSDVEIPDDQLISVGSLFCTICAGNGVFPSSFFAGGGTATLNQQSDINITVLRRCKLDRPPQVAAAWFDEQRGLLTNLKPAILSALLCDVVNNRRVPWDPRFNGGPMLRDQLAPRACTAPRQVAGIDFVGLTLSFTASFDWNLT